MNGDLLTDFDFRGFMDAHVEGGTELSVGVYKKRIPVSLGVLDLDANHRAIGFREKPVLSFSCSMGIYAIGPGLVSRVPRTGVFGFDDLMELCLDQDIAVRAHPFDGLWLDIGRPEDYAEAAKVFHEHQTRLLPPVSPRRRPAAAAPLSLLVGASNPV
jgi:NDP-sugar pyrophosphorylase family protein